MEFHQLMVLSYHLLLLFLNLLFDFIVILFISRVTFKVLISDEAFIGFSLNVCQQSVNLVLFSGIFAPKFIVQSELVLFHVGFLILNSIIFNNFLPSKINGKLQSIYVGLFFMIDIIKGGMQAKS